MPPVGEVDGRAGVVAVMGPLLHLMERSAAPPPPHLMEAGSATRSPFASIMGSHR